MQETILIVDDEPDVRESTQMLLEDMGYRVIGVSDPSMVVDTAEAEHAAAILQDLRMPGLNVAGLVAALRSHPPTAEIPLIFFSASEDVSRTAARFNAWGYVQKPFVPEELAALLESAARPTLDERPGREEAVRNIRHLFHDHWNLIAALENYTRTLHRSDALPPGERRLVEHLTDALLKLEAKTDHLRAYLLQVVQEATHLSEGESRPPRRGPRPPPQHLPKRRS